MTSTNFCGIIKWIYQMVAVQMRPFKGIKPILKEYSLAKYFKYASTDYTTLKWYVFKQTFKSHNIFEKILLGGKTL